MTVKKDEVTIKRNIIEQDLMLAKKFIKTNRKKVTLFSMLALGIVIALASAFVVVNTIAEKNLSEYESIVEKYRENFDDKKAQESAIKKLTELTQRSGIGIAIDLAYYELGNIYFDQKDYKKAAENFKLFLQSGSSEELLSPLVANKMAIALEESGDIDGALKILSELDSRDGKTIVSDQVVYNLGRLYLKKGDKSKAKAAFERVIQAFPGSIVSVRAKERIFLIDSK